MKEENLDAGLSDCETDPGKSLTNMFVGITMGKRVRDGQCPVRRAVFLKPHGVAKADFLIMPGLAEDLRVGIFAHKQFDACIRFSSDTVPGNPDMKTTVGVGIKLFGVAGKKMLEDNRDATTADFVMQNMNIFFVDTATDMCEFTKAGVLDGDYNKYLDAHPITRRILGEMRKDVKSCLQTNYWSALPYAFGNRVVKYKLEPIAPPFSIPPSQNSDDYLAADMQARLNIGESQFKFLVKFSSDPTSMPTDQATTVWDEHVSVPIHLATVVINKQDVSTQGQSAYGDNLSFNPWRTLEEHQPLGSINEARRMVYKASADYRRFKNGVPAVEPQVARELTSNKDD